MLKIVFMGTPDFALPSLKKLCDEHDVVCVYTQPPRPKGRGYELTPSPVQIFAEKKGIPVRTPASLKTTDEQTAFKALGADLTVGSSSPCGGLCRAFGPKGYTQCKSEPHRAG